MHRPEQERATTLDEARPSDGPPGVGEARIDGVDVRWGDSPGPLRAVMTFRVGMADEELRRRGITHLVEHLALSGCPLRREDYNGCVTDVTTAFMAAGDPDEIRVFLESTVAALAALPVGRLATERRILRTEDEGRGRSIAAIASGLRFGARTHGLSNTGDVGLPAIDESTVLAWARRHFVRGNAVLWLSGPPPEDLDLSALPAGDRVPPPAVRPRPLPAWASGLHGGIGVSMLGTRSVELSAGVRILERRLHRRLRQDEGRSYQVGTAYERWTADDAEVLLYADAQAEETDAVREALAEELHRIGDRGPTAEELDDVARERAKHRTGIDAAARSAAWRSDELLLTGTEPSEAEIADQYAAMTAAGVARVMSLTARSAIWIVPPGHGVADRRVVPLPDAGDRPAEGRRYRRVRGVVRELAGDELRVGESEVGVLTSEGWRRTIGFADVAALQVWADGARTVWAQDGSQLFLHPGAWRDGAAAMAGIDAGVPDGLVVRTGEDSGYDPADDLRPRRGLLGARR